MIVEIYSRPGCHLCDEAKTVLTHAAERHAFELIERNVEDDPRWEADFGHEIPVVFIDGRKAFKYRIPLVDLERRLSRRQPADGKK